MFENMAHLKCDAPMGEKRMLNIGTNIGYFPHCVISKYTAVSQLGAWHLPALLQ